MGGRGRMAVLMLVLVATLAAIFYPVDDTDQDFAVKRANAQKPLATSARPLAAGEKEDEDVDPFAPRGWTAAPPPSPPAPIAQAAAPAVPVAPPPPPGPPALPFKFMGRFSDESGEVVYLNRGDQVLLAKSGEVIESTYKVAAVRAQQIEFEHLPTGSKQVLPLPDPDR